MTKIKIKAIKQEETTGCGIASVANIVGKSYSEIKAVANSMGIFAVDKALWSDTQYVRRLLKKFGVFTADKEKSFTSWSDLPDLALLSIRYHKEDGKNFWHWVVFKRVGNEEFVLDSAVNLPNSIRRDFEHMTPKWYIACWN
ncbi:hypothetical protein [Snodgrassella sp. CFCC 13594]|uniref:hypothetical protein n=1 Tax=Snodgrassella sp. CFCC 13594 TaxID=1775559 RepID=UPI00082AC138|nr:hypothetical protein [Snodgrassella sp. CFCC 13594]